MEIAHCDLCSINEPECLPANCRSVGINSGNSAYHLKYRHVLPPPRNVSIISIPAIRSDIQRPHASNSLAATHVARHNCRPAALCPRKEFRENITPKYTGRRKPQIMAILKLLSRSNCKRCGTAGLPARSSPPRWQKAGSGRNTALSLQKKVGGRLSNTWRDLILIDGSGQRAQKFSGRYNPYAAVIHIFLAFEVYLIKVRYI